MAESAAPVGGRVVDPDGSIHYDFDGHVRARGVDLTAAPTFATPESLPVDSVVDWVQADGGMAARIWGRQGGVLRLAGDSEVRARAELGGGLAIERTLIRDDGYSDFALAADAAASDLSDVAGWLLAPLDLAYTGTPNAPLLSANQTGTWLTGGTWTAPPGVDAAQFLFVGLVQGGGPGGGWVRILYRDVTAAGPYNTVADYYNDCLSGEYALALAAGSFGFPANGHDYEVTAQYVRSNNPGSVGTKNAALAVFRG